MTIAHGHYNDRSDLIIGLTLADLTRLIKHGELGVEGIVEGRSLVQESSNIRIVVRATDHDLKEWMRKHAKGGRLSEGDQTERSE